MERRENEWRGTSLEELLGYPYMSQEPEDAMKLQIIRKYITFFPIDDHVGWWNEYVDWFNRRQWPVNASLVWNIFIRLIQSNQESLAQIQAEYELMYDEPSDEEDEDGTTLASLPLNFSSHFSRISEEIVGAEWMLHKWRQSRYSPNLILRLAVYQMQTGATTTGTFLDLLCEYVRDTLQSQLN